MTIRFSRVGVQLAIDGIEQSLYSGLYNTKDWLSYKNHLSHKNPKKAVLTHKFIIYVFDLKEQFGNFR